MPGGESLVPGETLLPDGEEVREEVSKGGEGEMADI